MYDPSKGGLYIADCENGPICICGKMANRHGLVAGATGTGKTVTLQVIAESFCQAGVPCFMADMKGDLSGISQNGKGEGCPTQFFDVFGEKGVPMRTTISEMGPQLLSRLFGLNETQSGVLDIVFRIADEKGLLLIDIKDLRAMLNYVSEHAGEYQSIYGNIAAASIGSIQRALLSLENQGADKFFAEPSFEVADLMRTFNGKGMMSVLAADKLMLNPKLYSSFLLWLLSDIYEALPEVGDCDLPKLVFFFDEAHTLFDDTAPALVDKIEQVVRLIRSKGVGVYFVTQNPSDIPDSILGQLGNRVQHALRAYTPKDMKAVKAAADSFRPNPAFKTADVITELGTGEALISFLDEKGAPSVVQHAHVTFPPCSQVGAITDEQRKQIIDQSGLMYKYGTMIDRESAYEDLSAQQQQAEAEAEAAAEAKVSEKEEKKSSAGAGKAAQIGGNVISAAFGAALTSVTRSVGTKAAHSITGTKSRTTSGKNIANRAITNATSSALRTLTRSILGNLIK